MKPAVLLSYNFNMAAHPTDYKCSDGFYLRQLAMPKGNVWYSCQPIGHQKLATVVGDMAKHVNLEGKITNHSLRATAASHLYQQNVDEQLVMETTGHHSNCVHNYKHMSSEQLHYLSGILYGN